MKLERYMAVLTLFVCCQAGLTDEHPAADFAWQQPLSGTFESDTLYRLRAPADLFDGCRAFPQDLRIFDAGDRQWPWYLWQPAGSSRFQALATETLNQLAVEGDDPYLQLDLLIVGADSPAGRPRHNRLEIDTPGSNFIRKVEVFGSDDREKWGRLGNGFLIDHRQPNRVRNSYIRYPESDLPYLQIRIHRNARQADESLQVTSLKIGMNAVVDGEWEEVPLTPLEVPEKEEREGAAVTMYDIGANRRPMERLFFEITDKEYARPVQVFGRHSPTNHWRQLYSGEIHQFEGQGRNKVSLGSAAYRQLKIELFHYDDAPLQVSAVTGKAVPRYLVFEAQSAGPATLYFGADRIRNARFDLERRRGPKEAARARVVEVGTRIPNEAYQQPSIERFIPWIVGIAIALVSALLIWVIAGMLKKSPDLTA